MSVQGNFYQRSFEQHRDEMGDREEVPAAYRSAVDHMRATRPARAAELGFGIRSPIVEMCRHVGAMDVIDIVEALGEGLPENCTPIAANLDEALPLADGEYDCVLAIAVIEHLYDPFHSFAEVARILKPGGVAFIDLPNIAGAKNRLRLLAGRLPVTSSKDWFELREWDGNHLHYFTVDSVRRVADLNGLDLVATHTMGKLQVLKRLRPSLFADEIAYTLKKRG